MTSFLSLHDAIRQYVNDGATVAMEGFTSFGYGVGGDHRQRLGIRTVGPTLVVTDLCLLRPDPLTKELVVVSLHQGVRREDIVQNTGWSIRFATTLEQTMPPNETELTVLRNLHAKT